jgi:hypothetical protein
MDGCIGGWKDEWVGGVMDGWVDGWMDGWMNGWMCLVTEINIATCACSGVLNQSLDRVILRITIKRQYQCIHVTCVAVTLYNNILDFVLLWDFVESSYTLKKLFKLLPGFTA